MTICAAIFAVVGAGVAFAYFFVGIAYTGVKAVPMPWAILGYLVNWPFMILMLILPENLSNSLSNNFWLGTFGLPMLGWALFGIGLEAWRARRDDI